MSDRSSPFAGIRRIFRIANTRRDVEDELRFHFDETVNDLVHRGWSVDAARDEARRRFGDERQWRREMERINERRETRRARTEWMSARAQDVRYALRRLRRSPWLTVGVVLAFALGIGANGTMFGIVDRLLLSPPPHIANPDALHPIYINEMNPLTKERLPNNTLAYPDYQAMGGVRAFSGVAAYANRQVTLGHGADARKADGILATGGYFHVLGVQPEAGRFFTDEEARIGAGHVAVLSHGMAERAFGGARQAVGKTLDFGFGPYVVVGVTPRGFTGAELKAVDLWLPLEAAQAEESGDNGQQGWASRQWIWLKILARVAPGAPLQRAEAEATAAYRRSVAADPHRQNPDSAATVIAASVIAARAPTAGAGGLGAVSVKSGSQAGVAAVSVWLAGVSFIVLLIACANVANLLLARAMREQREIGIRLALGISRRRLLGQVMLEALLLAAVGAVAAVAVVTWVGPMLSRFMLPDIAWGDLPGHGRELAFIGGLALLAGLVSGIIPALQATRPQVLEALRAGSHSATRRLSWTRSTLTVVQAMLSIVLLVGAGLFVRSLHRVQSLDIGIDPRGLLLATPSFDRGTEREVESSFLDRSVERLSIFPGVTAAAVDLGSPFAAAISMGGLRIPGRDSLPRLPGGGPYVDAVTPDFFRAVGLRVAQGRGFRASDDQPGAAPTVIVNETMAHMVWPGKNAVGECLIINADSSKDKPATCSQVIGVVHDARRFRIQDEDAAMQYYLPLHATPLTRNAGQYLLVRVRGDAAATVPAIRRAILGVGGPVRFVDIAPIAERIQPQMRAWKLGAVMFTTFGLLALVVAAIGLYSVLAYGVAERIHELGVRAALGASRGRLVGLVLRRGLRLVVVGAVVGVLIALAAAPKVEPLLFNTSARDPLILGIVSLTLLVVAVAASAIPAWRATRVDPQQALRSE